MAINWDKEYGTSEPKKSKINWEKEYNPTGFKERIDTEKADLRSKGLPVSVRDDRSAPTGGGEMLRGIIGLGADVLANARNAGRIITGQEEKPVFKSRYLGDVKGLGKFDFTKSPFEKENLKTLIKSASTGAEIASYLNATGVAKSTIANLTKQGVLASKKTFAEWAVKMMPELAKEGFGQGIAYTVGSQGREYAETSKPFSGKQAIIDVATSTLGNVVIPTALQKMFGKSTNKIMAARAAERVLSDTEILGRKIPDAGVPSAKYMTESGRTLPAPRKPNEIPIEMPSPEIAASQRRLNEVPKVETPDFKAKVSEGETVLDNHYNNPDASPGSHKLYSETVYNDITKDPERVRRIAMGSNEATTNGVPADAYYAIAKNEAVKSGDVQAIKDLANSNVGSISGQKLEANKLTQEGDIIDTLRDIKKARAKAVGVSEEAIKKQETTFVQKLKTSVKNLSDDIINDLICK